MSDEEAQYCAQMQAEAEAHEAENAAMARSAADYCRNTRTDIPNIDELSAGAIVWNLRFMAYCAGYRAAMDKIGEEAHRDE